jgi:Crossover junction endodeoxyribonuclease RuvC.
MRIIGIDPGIAIMGYGIIDDDCGKFKVLEYGAITTVAGIKKYKA